MDRIATALLHHPTPPEWDKTLKQTEVDAEARRGAAGPPRISDGTDLTDRLPPLAAKKLRALRRERDELNTLTQADFDQYQELIQERQKAKARLIELTDLGAAQRTGDGQIYGTAEPPVDAKGNRLPEHPSVTQARANFDRFGAKLEALKQVQDARRERKTAVGHLLTSTEAYLRTLPFGEAVASFDMDPPQRPKGQTAETAVEKMRHRRRELLSDIKAVQTAPIHSSVVKAKVRKLIDDLAEKARPDPFNLIEGGDQLQLPRKSLRLPVEGFVREEGAPSIYAMAAGHITDIDALFVRYHKDQMLADWEAQIDADADDENALSDPERFSRETSLREELLSVERQEEALTEIAGMLRRADLDPRAFLGIEAPTPTSEAYS